MGNKLLLPYLAMNRPAFLRCLLASPMTSRMGSSCWREIGKDSAIQHRAVNLRPLPFLLCSAAAAAAAATWALSDSLSMAPPACGLPSFMPLVDSGSMGTSWRASRGGVMAQYSSKVPPSGRRRGALVMDTAASRPVASYTRVRHPATFSVESLPNRVLAGLKWKSVVFIFVLPAPALSSDCTSVSLSLREAFFSAWTSIYVFFARSTSLIEAG
mmetsp:Transcript_13264/g.40168  ORF Transcript_13264/g.40168 Transcript_13264/m.40168 type:complete len:214 (+) Transcript_13264:573-1214(+)